MNNHKQKHPLKKLVKKIEHTGHAGGLAKKLIHVAKHGVKKLGGLALKHLTRVVTGHGDYHLAGSASLNKQDVSFGSGDTTISHSEYVGDISGTTAFNLASYKINPTNSILFPWLANQASCYQEYQIEGMIIEYRSTSASALNSTNTALGTIILSCNYDCDAPNFSNKFQMENFAGAISASPNHNVYYGIECKRSKTVESKLYTTVSGDDDRLSYLGNLQIATIGMQSAAVVGELWVHYKVRLMKPKAALVSSATDFFQIGFRGTSVLPATPWGPAATSTQIINSHGKLAGASVRVANPDTIDFPRRWSPGLYLILHYIDTASTFTSATSLVFGGSLATSVSVGNFYTVASGTSVSGLRRADTAGYIEAQFVMVGDTDTGTSGIENPCWIGMAATGNNWAPTASTRIGMIIVPLSSYPTLGWFSGGSNQGVAPLAMDQVVSEVMRRIGLEGYMELEDPDPPVPEPNNPPKPAPAGPGPYELDQYNRREVSPSGSDTGDFIHLDDNALRRAVARMKSLAM